MLFFLHSSNKIQKPQITVVVVLLRKYAWIWFVSHKSPHVLMLLNFCHQIRIWQTSFSFACLLWIIVVVVFVVVYAATSTERTFFSTNFLNLYNFRRVIFGLFIVDVVVCLITHTLVLPPAPNWQCCGILQPILASHSTDWKLILWVCVSRSVYIFFWPLSCLCAYMYCFVCVRVYCSSHAMHEAYTHIHMHASDVLVCHYILDSTLVQNRAERSSSRLFTILFAFFLSSLLLLFVVLFGSFDVQFARMTESSRQQLI